MDRNEKRLLSTLLSVAMGPLGGHSGVCVVFTALVAMHL